MFIIKFNLTVDSFFSVPQRNLERYFKTENKHFFVFIVLIETYFSKDFCQDVKKVCEIKRLNICYSKDSQIFFNLKIHNNKQ